MDHHLKPKSDTVKYEVSPLEVGWSYLGYRVVTLNAGESYQFATSNNEAALVPLSGAARLEVNVGSSYEVARKNVCLARNPTSFTRRPVTK